MDLGERNTPSVLPASEKLSVNVEPLSDARTKLADIFNILLQFLHDPFSIADQFHVTLSVKGLSLRCAGRLDGAFPIGHLCAAFGGKFLICHAGDEFQ